MGKEWDNGIVAFSTELWREALRVAKPGAHLLAFGGTRTYHRLACAIEDAGWEIRDCIMWVYGSGFPKSHNVSKAIDREAGAEREVVGQCKRTGKESGTYGAMTGNNLLTAPATDAAREWDGWGTALKPAYEPIIVARKPLVGTVAANVQQYGTGAINVDGCRVRADDVNKNPTYLHKGHNGNSLGAASERLRRSGGGATHTSGRWPANFIHDGGDEVTAGLGESARFFYTAKASKRDRDEGCEGLPVVTHQSGMGGAMPTDDDGNARDRFKAESRNHHPTVKPTDLMRYLCRLVTPPGGTMLDPFMGSGSTGKGATLEGFNFIGIEQNAEYIEIAKARIQHAIDSASEKLFLEPV
jgi:site-specific DNA-methyltransferase (adenine-specific)